MRYLPTRVARVRCIGHGDLPRRPPIRARPRGDAYACGVGWVIDEVGRGRVVFADRTGGVSQPPFHWTNTGNNVGDEPEAVWENRRRVGDALGGTAADPSRWARVRVEHGAKVVTVSAFDAGPVTGDAVITRDPNIALSFRSADCGPLVIGAGEHVALVHIGWRGLAAGVVTNALEALRLLEPEAPIEAALGPTIGACCYTLPRQSVELIEASTGVRVRASDAGDEALPVDLTAGIAAIAADWGVMLRTLDVCTACSDHYFSFRRDRERAGRQATVVCLPSN